MSTPTWRDLAAQALNVQDACNLSGVVHGFARAIGDVRTLLESEKRGGTDAVNNHPVCRLWADKVASLTGTQSFGRDEIQQAYSWAFAQQDSVQS